MRLKNRVRRFIRTISLSAVSAHVQTGGRVLEIGGDRNVSLNELNPSFLESFGLPEFLRGENREKLKGDWDLIICHFLTDSATDIHKELKKLKSIANPTTRIILITYNRLYLPVLRVLTTFGLKTKTDHSNYLSLRQLRTLAATASLRPIKSRGIQPIFPTRRARPTRRSPLSFFLPGQLVFAPLRFLVCRAEHAEKRDSTISVIVPARNEAGNIERIIRDIPRFAKWQELIFVEGGSSDGTWDKIKVAQAKVPIRENFDEITAIQQSGTGKGNAVRNGIKIAQGDVIAIFDADLSVSGPALRDFFNLIQNGKCEFVNGTRMVYDKEKNAMQFLNVLGNKAFASILSMRTGYSFSDVLCGTKMFLRADYEKTYEVMTPVREADPFGDFELLLGMSRLSLEMLELPVRYQARTYGKTNISRFRDGGRLVKTLLRSSSIQ